MSKRERISKEVTKALLSARAIFLRPQEPFTWASGIKSPIYCDNRLILGFVKERKVIEDALCQVLLEEYKDVEVLMGTSTAGIPHAAIVSSILSLPMGYVRSGSKEHGRNNQIEGANPAGKRVVVIEDLISTGGSSIDVVETLREAGAEVLGILSIFTYGMKKGIERLEQAKVKNVSLSNFELLSKVANQEGYITDIEKRMLEKFIESPDDPSWQLV